MIKECIECKRTRQIEAKKLCGACYQYLRDHRINPDKEYRERYKPEVDLSGVRRFLDDYQQGKYA